jgi:5-methylcytosine-specific restriction endonuclease McrA
MTVLNFRPKCINYNCAKPVAHSGQRYRPVCGGCHKAGYGAGTYAAGVRPFRTGCCSNRDGHLGFGCYIDWARVAEDGARIKTHIDHKDGNHLNNVPSNCEELCETCHSEKGRRAGDYRGYRYA